MPRDQPERVFAEIFRVLKPGGCCIVTFSNRLYYDKARLRADLLRQQVCSWFRHACHHSKKVSPAQLHIPTLVAYCRHMITCDAATNVVPLHSSRRVHFVTEQGDAQAIQAWRDSSGYGRVQLVKQYFLCVSGTNPLYPTAHFFCCDACWSDRACGTLQPCCRTFASFVGCLKGAPWQRCYMCLHAT